MPSTGCSATGQSAVACVTIRGRSPSFCVAESSSLAFSLRSLLRISRVSKITPGPTMIRSRNIRYPGGGPGGTAS